MIGNDEDFIREILSEFQYELEDLSEKISSGFENRDIVCLQQHVHNLKGISGNVCAIALHRILIDIDAALGNNDISQASSHLERFLHQKSAAADFLRKFLDNESK